MFFEREQYTTPVCEMQGCMAFLRRKRQKTGRSELLPAAFVQFYGAVSGCVSQSSAPRRKNSAAVVLRALYNRGSITPAAGSTTLTTRIARHRLNSTRTVRFIWLTLLPLWA